MEKTDKSNENLMRELFQTGAHYGYSSSRRHPSMKPVIFGSKNSVQIIDLEKTLEYLSEALEFITQLGKEGKQILFVGSKAEAKAAIHETATTLEQPYVTERWIGGTLTNHKEIKKRVARLEKLEEEEAKGSLGVYTKKERLLFQREKEKLATYFSGIRILKETPDALFVVDPKHESIAISEAQKCGVPVIALMNLDCNMSEAKFPIPANDASLKTIDFVLKKVVTAYQAGKTESR
ncbi:MAG TPA: 30S ribosomal protein S2 [Candidatus Paceibacterota bacterium]|nr:30S ribosomal protein S2 [Candidatus Paceibacterota bacterium]